MIKRLFLIIGVAILLSQAKVFRSDYEFIEEVNGWMKMHIVPSIWSEARMRCHAEGAVLVSPLTEELRRSIIEFVLKKNGAATTTIFTGIHATFSKGDYTSIEGVPLIELPLTWAAGEPDNYDNAESCLAMSTENNGIMYDVQCGKVLPYYVCFRKFLLDKAITECGTTDADYHLERRTGSCYKFHRRGLIWQQAFMTCLAEGGHLAIINSEIEAAVIREIFGKYPDNTIRSTDPGVLAVGFHDWGEHMTFLTIHGETLDQAGYQHWANKQPDNATRPRTGDLGEFCGTVFRDGRLNDIACNVPVPFLCEKKPASFNYN